MRATKGTQTERVAAFLDLLLKHDPTPSEKPCSLVPAPSSPSEPPAEEPPAVDPPAAGEDPPASQDTPASDDTLASQDTPALEATPALEDGPDVVEAAAQVAPPPAVEQTQPARIVESHRSARAARRKARPTTVRGKQGSSGVRRTATATLIPVLAIVLLLLVRRPMKGPASASGGTPKSEAAAPQVTSDVNVAWQPPVVYQPNSRDPMKLTPPVVQEGEPNAARPGPRPRPPENLDVRGVLFSADRPAAIIGTRVVHVGEEVSGATVIAIERNSIEFEKNGQRWKQTVSGAD